MSAEDDIEAVARELCERHALNPDAKVTRYVLSTGCSPVGQFSYLPEDHYIVPLWYFYRDTAKVVIKLRDRAA
jgi:hypothetical protein